MSPYGEAALANLDDAIASIQSALAARTERDASRLLVYALRQAANARAKFAEALTPSEEA